MNPISLVTTAITHPTRTVGAVAGATIDVAGLGLRTTARVVGRAVEWAAGGTPQPPVPDVTNDRATDVLSAPPVTVPAPTTPAPTTPAPTTPAPSPAKKATAKEATAKKATAKKATTTTPAAKKATAKKPAARKAASKRAAVVAPALGLTEDEALDDELRTPSGIPAAGPGMNPDTTETDLHQPGTEPLMDPSTVKAAASEAEMMRRASDVDKG